MAHTRNLKDSVLFKHIHILVVFSKISMVKPEFDMTSILCVKIKVEPKFCFRKTFLSFRPISWYSMSGSHF